MIISTRSLTESLENKYGLTKSLKEEDTKENRKFFKGTKWFSYSHKDPVIAKFMEDCKLSMGSMDGYPRSGRFSLKPPFKSSYSVAYFVEIEFHNFDTGEGQILLWDRTRHEIAGILKVSSYDEIFKWLKTHPVDNDNIMDSVKMYFKTDHNIYNEAWEEEFDDEYDDIMADDSLSEQEKVEKVDSLVNTYDEENESLNEGWMPLNKISRYHNVADEFQVNDKLEIRNTKTGKIRTFTTNRGGQADDKVTVNTKNGKTTSVAKETLKDEIETLRSENLGKSPFTLTDSLNESFVEEWWGQTDEDPFDFAYEYGLTCKEVGRNGDEILYRFTGEKEDFDEAKADGYFYSIAMGGDEGHSEDLNESLNEAANDSSPSLYDFFKAVQYWSINNEVKTVYCNADDYQEIYDEGTLNFIESHMDEVEYHEADILDGEIKIYVNINGLRESLNEAQLNENPLIAAAARAAIPAAINVASNAISSAIDAKLHDGNQDLNEDIDRADIVNKWWDKFDRDSGGMQLIHRLAKLTNKTDDEIIALNTVSMWKKFPDEGFLGYFSTDDIKKSLYG